MFEWSRRCKQLHVKMITNLARDKHKRILLIGLISMIVICGQVASLTATKYNGGGGGDDDDDDKQSVRDAQGRQGTAVDNEQMVGLPRQSATTVAPVDALRNLLLVLAVREFCSRHPAECDQSDQLDTSVLFASGPERGEQYERQYSRKRRHEPPSGSVRMTNSINDIIVGLPVGGPARYVRNTTAVGRVGRSRGDDLDREGSSWTMTENDRARRAAAAVAASPARPTGWHRVPARSWHQLGLRTGPNTYRVTLEEARRFIRAQQDGQASYAMGTMAPALLYARPRVAGDSLEQQQQVTMTARVHDEHQQHQPLDEFYPKPAALATGGSSSEPITRSRAPVTIREQRSNAQQTPLFVPKRTELSPENPFAAEGTTTTKTTASSGGGSSSSSTTTTSDHQLVQEKGRAPGDKNREVMQCNLRSYTYRATKADGRGNTCTGLITASICYGGCDSGEIADWLFPYKKSIHKVCRHGGRIRRRALLSECHSQDSGEQPIDESLREYHYVDARDCICKKCTGADTNCLGTMTQPHLQTLGETVAELTAAYGD